MKKLIKELYRPEIKNNWVHPPKQFLDKLGITSYEFIFLKWKKYRDFELIKIRDAVSPNF